MNSVDIQIRLLGGQFKMRLEVNALGLFCFVVLVDGFDLVHC